MGTRPPNNKTKTRPGLGVGGDLPRLNSAEIRRSREKVRDDAGDSTRGSFPSNGPVVSPTATADTMRPRPPRESVRREDPDDPVDLAPQKSPPPETNDRPVRPRESLRREDPPGPSRPALRSSMRREDPPDPSRPALRSSVRREDPPDPSRPALRSSVRREDPPDPSRPALRSSMRRDDPDNPARPATLRDSVRREDPPATTPGSTPARSDRPRGSRPASWKPEATTGMRRKRSARPPVIVDQVGAAAVKLARTTRRGNSAPKTLATPEMIAKAPLDVRTAFVLSLVDGRNTVEALVDMAGMPDEEVKGILARLARLGLITSL